MRFAEVQAAPPLRIFANNNCGIVTARSASSCTITWALPPSSIEQRITLSAASFNRTRPTSVDPVKDKFLTRESCNIFEIAGPVFSGITKFKTPLGNPARSKISTICIAVSGVSVAGFKIMVQPAATAGPIFRVAMPAGKFQGVISMDNPIG